MRKVVFIDGYNLLRKQPRWNALLRSHADAARAACVRAVTRSLGHDTDAVLVFDGHGKPIVSGCRMRVVFAASSSADAWIRRQLESIARPRNAMVVSSDHEVTRHARAMGAGVCRSEDFLRSIERGVGATPGIDRNRGLSEAEVREWLQMFGAASDAEHGGA
jgi:predicted RNA-binding protein with PIN domain